MIGDIKMNNYLYQGSIRKDKLKAGDTSDKVELRIDERTVIFVDPKFTPEQMEIKRQQYLINMAKYK